MLSAQPPAIELAHFQLSPPAVNAPEPFFEDSTILEVLRGQEGTLYRYATVAEGLENATVVKGAVMARESGTFYFQGFHPDFQPSPIEAVTITDVARALAIRVAPGQPPSSAYSGQGPQALSNRARGGLQFRTTPDEWLGWEVGTLRLQIYFEGEERPGKLMLGALDDAAAWILPPKEVSAYQGGRLIGRWSSRPADKGQLAALRLLDIPLAGATAEPIELEVQAAYLPDWHDGAGQRAWIFLDEVLLFPND